MSLSLWSIHPIWTSRFHDTNPPIWVGSIVNCYPTYNGLQVIETGVPQGSCVSPILAAYFTSPMIREVHQRTSMCIIKTPELSSLLAGGNITLSPITLYVDDRAILASGPTLEMTAQLATF